MVQLASYSYYDEMLSVGVKLYRYRVTAFIVDADLVKSVEWMFLEDFENS